MTQHRSRRFLCAGATVCLAGTAVAACGTDSPVAPKAATSLRTLAAQRGVRIGAATGGTFQRTDATGDTLRAILAREFDMVWSGNFLKFDYLRPNPGTFAFAWADSMTAFARAHAMTVRGHTFVWHNQIPSWLSGSAWTGPQVDSILADHITTVMNRFRGAIGVWDVVNEAVDDAGSRRATFWSTALGPGYIERAFRLARTADATAQLFYNDYNIEGLSAKADSVYAMLSDLKERGVPVDGIGMQGHFIVGQLPSSASLLANFARFAQLGLKIQITELDIRMPIPATAPNLAQQAIDYRTILSACLQTPACDAVELAGVYDGDSWVPSTFPGQGAALLYDSTFHVKPAYTGVSEVLAGR